MILRTPRVVIAGLSGDAGKTLVAVGLAGALSRRGRLVAPYKKGPDYIDAAWLAAAAGWPGRNLDTFLMPPEALGASLARAAGADLIVVEGNRGLHDGSDAHGTHSTAALARQLCAPVVLVVDATKATRTLAACVRGCAAIDPELDLAGVILNRVAGRRHERVVREAFEALGGPPVLGAIPKLGDDPLPSRHLGLVTAVEHGGASDAVARAADIVTAHVDVDRIVTLAGRAGCAEFPPCAAGKANGRAVRIGVLRDEAFSFYYPENLEALEEAGATLVTVSPLRAASLPELDALYIGGGFPEVHAAALAANEGFRASLAAAAREGLPIYAECGGLMYLARELRVGGQGHAMAGVLDVVVEQTPKPVGHGYVDAVVHTENAFFPVGARLRGHEFHYSRLVGEWGGPAALRLERGTGIGGGRDALVAGAVWASYLHLHALGSPEWARGVAAAARGRQRAAGSRQ